MNSVAYGTSTACVKTGRIYLYLDFKQSCDTGTAKVAPTSSVTPAGSTSAWLVDRQTKSSRWYVCMRRLRATAAR